MNDREPGYYWSWRWKFRRHHSALDCGIMKYLWLCVAFVVGVSAAAYALTGTSPPVDIPIIITGSTGSTICNNPAVPNPANAVGFTTLAYCADFTQQSAINNVVYGSGGGGGAQTTNWTSMSWLDCNAFHQGAVAGKQWFNYEVATGGGQYNPCSAKTVAIDAASGVNALQLTAIHADGSSILGITTAVDACSDTTNACYEVFPTTNLYAEISWRVNLSEWSNITDSNEDAQMDFWSWYANTSGNSGGTEVDFIEYFGNANGNFTVGPGVANRTGGSTSYTIDSNYHTIGDLVSSNRTNFLTSCVYRDGVQVMSPSNTCASVSGAGAIFYAQQGYITVSNYANHVSVVSGPVHLYIAWIRIWTCAGWNTTGNPVSTSNTCSVASPPTTPP